MAKLVMRRDLALCRERDGLPKHVPVNGTLQTTSDAQQSGNPIAQGPSLQKSTEEANANEDVTMHDSQQDLLTGLEQRPTQGNANGDAPAKLLDGDDEADAKPANEEPKDPSSLTEGKVSDSSLHLDTQTKPDDAQINETREGDDDNPPDTAISTANDLDSLFGAPASVEAGGAAEDFSMDDPNNTNEFDFGSFGDNLDNNAADNDNISALLPGLQDYANTQPTEDGQPDFDALFSTDMPITAEDGQQMPTEHRDSTFDDLMNFGDFNASDFAESGGGGTGEGGGNENQEFDFSFD